MIPRVSLFASAIRKQFFDTFFNSLSYSTIQLEVIFAGILEEVPFWKMSTTVDFKYIHTENIKPAQCYEIARRACSGELIHWTADDAVYTPDFLAKAYDYWKLQNNPRLILSLQTKENGQFCNMNYHSFFGMNANTPLMAPLGLMSREFADECGGFDKRFVCGQQENGLVMEALARGGEVKVFGDKHNLIVLDHYARHGIKRPFAEGYNRDREVLEASWTDGKGNCVMTRMDKHESFEDKDILIKSQSNNLPRWV